MLRRERPVEHHLQRTDLLASLGQPQRRLASHFGTRAHRDDDALRLRMAVIAEQPVLAAAQAGELVHRRLYDRRRRRVIRVRRFARLKEGVRVVRRAAHDGVSRTQRPIAMVAHQILVDHRPHGVVGEQDEAVDLVRGAESVHEVDEGHARLERRRLRHQGEVVRLLHRSRRQHGEAGRAHRHHVLMVAEDGQRLRRQRARRHVHDGRRQLAGDLEHVGVHQQKALRRREGRRQRAALQRPVQCARRTALGLHLLHDRHRAQDVGDALRRPFVRQLCHRRRRRDRKDRADLVQPVGDVGNCRVAVHRVGYVGHRG